MSAMIGVLGGMGPMATVDFVTKIINQTPARSDQEHLPLLIHSIPQIPDRSACLMEHKTSPLPALLKGAETLIDAGVGCIAIPCNTAHYWYDDIAKASDVPVLHIADACADELETQNVRSVGLLATDGTLKADFYTRKLASRNIRLQLPDEVLQQQVMDGIYRVKSGDIDGGGKVLECCLNTMLDRGVERVILGCTEIPLALDHIQAEKRAFGLDATLALAATCVAWHASQQQYEEDLYQIAV